MVSIATTQLSSKGQVVIPEEIRRQLRLRPGHRFVVFVERGIVVFKSIQAPDPAEFDDLVAIARKQARRAKVTPKEVAQVVRQVRSKG